ncbi:hypothetical protein GCM10025777_19730 [Membranihabitans marinus]
MVSCIPDNDEVVIQSGEFSVGLWMDSIFNNNIIDSVQSEVTKTIVVNDLDPETKSIKDYHILTDLKQIKEMDFSSVRWVDSYDKTSRDSGQYRIVEYITDNTKAPATYFKAEYDSLGQLQTIFIKKNKQSIVSDQSSTIRWQKNSGYTVLNQSKFLFQSPALFKMEVVYD